MDIENLNAGKQFKVVCETNRHAIEEGIPDKLKAIARCIELQKTSTPCPECGDTYWEVEKY